MLIRVEIPIDAPGIDALLRRSFESDAEAKLVHDLREDGFLTLGLVATDDEGQVIGYVAFSPVDVQGEDLQWVGMAPLAVDEKYRGQGLARQLVYEGLDSLNEFGYAAVVTLGEPAFYGRLGFEPSGGRRRAAALLWPEKQQPAAPGAVPPGWQGDPPGLHQRLLRVYEQHRHEPGEYAL